MMELEPRHVSTIIHVPNVGKQALKVGNNWIWNNYYTVYCTLLSGNAGLE